MSETIQQNEEPIIKVKGISKNYTTKTRMGLFKKEVKVVEALKKLNLEIKPGEIFGLLGPNGAGKTTLIKILTTLLIPSEGTATVANFDIIDEANDVRRSVGCMLMGERGLYWKLTGRENLNLFGSLYRVPNEYKEKKIEWLIEVLELEEFIDRPVESFSSGQKMKVAFAKALLHDAPILILDEPTIAMDFAAARKLREVVKMLNKEGKTIIYTTHLMDEAQELCNRIAIIDHGEIIALDTTENLIDQLEQDDIITLAGEISEKTVKQIKSLEGVHDMSLVAKNGNEHYKIICVDHKKVLPGLITSITSNGSVVNSINVEQPTLGDVFIKLTGRSLSEDTAERGE
ncbi:MAG: ABC transporter ATP-binding protein [Candidatus Kariarchaeaceae archaeon]